MKRIFDLVLVTPALILCVPVMLIVAVLVKIDSSGPVLFRHERVGRHGLHFHVLKFRSMRSDKGSRPAGPEVTALGDPRITRVGHMLRSSKLDELPQLFNVLGGQMSLVGPRPEVPKYVRLWTTEQRREILSVRPGVTDPVSVKFRRESELLAQQEDSEAYYVQELLPHKAALYQEYVRTRSLRGDARILLHTIRSVVGE